VDSVVEEILGGKIFQEFMSNDSVYATYSSL